MRRCSSPSSTRSTALSGERGCSRSARNSTRVQASCGGGVTSTRPGRPLDTSDPWEEELGPDSRRNVSPPDGLRPAWAIGEKPLSPPRDDAALFYSIGGLGSDSTALRVLCTLVHR